MGKAKESNKEAKKQAAKSPKEKKAAKQAKHLALAAEEHARDQLRVWEKAQKHLDKVIKKAAKANACKAKRPAATAAAPTPASPPS